MEIGVTEDELAKARFKVASAILDADNAGEIVSAMNTLTMMYVKEAQHQHKRGKKSKKAKQKAKRLKHTADEFYTIVMCAIYNKQDQSNG